MLNDVVGGLILPSSARLGISQTIGVMPTPSGKPGLEVVVHEGLVLVHCYRQQVDAKSGREFTEKHYTLEIPANSAKLLAELLDRASVKANKMPRRPKAGPATVIHR